MAVAFQGDLKSFPLPDLLQWLDSSRKPGRLTVTYAGGERVFYLTPGQVCRSGSAGMYERVARITRLMGLLDDHAAQAAVALAQTGARLEQAFAAAGVAPEVIRAIARDDIFYAVPDLFEDTSGTFHWSEDAESDGDETAQVDVSLRELLYESARRQDEAAAAMDLVRGDAVWVRLAKPVDSSVAGLSRAALACIGESSTVGAVRLALGISRPAAARMLFDLWRQGFLRIDGAEAPKPDPLTHMLRQGERLLADGHYDAAALVFNSLLAADPGDRRIRDFARAVEREHVEALYNKLSPVAVPRVVTPDASLSALRPDERQVAALVNGRWDVATLVLACPLRELQTLRAIERMAELGFVTLG